MHGFAEAFVQAIEGEDACKQQQPSSWDQAVPQQNPVDGLGGLYGIRHITEVGQQPTGECSADAHAGFLRGGGS